MTSDSQSLHCSVSGCSGAVFVQKYSLCRPHYRRLQKYGDPLLGSPVQPVGSKAGRLQPLRDYPCSVETCVNQALAKGLCSAHYSRLRQYGDVRADVPVRKYRMLSSDVCTVDECHLGQQVGGLCYTHYVHSLPEEDKAARFEVSRAWAKSHPEKGREYMRRHTERHPDRVLLRFAKRRSTIQSGDLISVESLRQRDGDLCCYCSKVLDFTGGAALENSATLEHITPLSRGGPHTWDNVALSCRTDNFSKSAKTPLEFLSTSRVGV